MSGGKFSLETAGVRIEAFLRPLLGHARIKADFQVCRGETRHADFENPDMVVKFTGPDVELLLENKAEVLLALEQLTMEALRMSPDEHSRVCFDANDYRMLRIEELRVSAIAAADKVRRTGVPFRFNPMNSRERRIIHLALREETGVRSESSGMGPARQVVIYPADMPSKPEAPQPAGAIRRSPTRRRR